MSHDVISHWLTSKKYQVKSFKLLNHIMCMYAGIAFELLTVHDFTYCSR